MRTAIRRVPGFLLTILVCAVTGSPAAAQTQPVYNVLTIHSGAVDFPANPVLDAGIREALFEPGAAIDYFTEYLEFDRFPQAETSLALGDYIRRKYEARHIDLVIAITSRALQFAVQHRDALFPGAPIVSASIGLDDDETKRQARGAVTGVHVGRAFAESLALALRLHPNTKRVFVVATSPNPSNEQAIRAQLHPLASKVPLTFFSAATMNDLLAAVRAVPPQSVILYIGFQRPGTGYVNDPAEPARLVAAAARVPVYGVVDSSIGTGVIGGMVRDVRQTGIRVGTIARLILAGTSPDAIPIEYAPSVPVFDARQLGRWGLDPAKLPAGSEIQFQSPTIWETYRGYIVSAGVVMAAQLVLIAALLAERSSRMRAETMLRAREDALHTSFRRIRRMAGHLINAQEAARIEIARDLHDDVCQGLVAVSMTVSSLKRSAGTIQSRRTQQTLSQLDAATRNAVDSVRRLSHDLHPASLRLVGLVAALKGHCLEVAKRHGVDVTFKPRGDFDDVPANVSVCLFRVAQEALRNGIVHGKARRLAVAIARTAGVIDLTVGDDGSGFDLAAVQRSGHGLGLISIEERAHVVGGTAQVITLAGRGTTIYVRVPVTATDGRETEPATIAPSRMLTVAATVGRVARAVDALKSDLAGSPRPTSSHLTGTTSGLGMVTHAAGRRTPPLQPS